MHDIPVHVNGRVRGVVRLVEVLVTARTLGRHLYLPPVLSASTAPPNHVDQLAWDIMDLSVPHSSTTRIEVQNLLELRVLGEYQVLTIFL